MILLPLERIRRRATALTARQTWLATSGNGHIPYSSVTLMRRMMVEKMKTFPGTMFSVAARSSALISSRVRHPATEATPASSTLSVFVWWSLLLFLELLVRRENKAWAGYCASQRVLNRNAFICFERQRLGSTMDFTACGLREILNRPARRLEQLATY